MAISVSYASAPYLITLPKSDLVLDTGTKYNLDVDVFWQLLRDYADSEEGMVNPVIYTRIPATASTPSITEVNIDYYSLQFEDGVYSVNVINGNTNIRNAEVKNQVSVNTNNTTGFIDQSILVYSTFNGGIYWDAVNGKASIKDITVDGNEANPLKNLVDVQAQAVAKGFTKIYVIGNVTVGATDVLDDYHVHGQNSSYTTITFITGASTETTTFKEAKLTGVLAGALFVEKCHLESLSGIGSLINISHFENCVFGTGTIQIRNASNKNIHFEDCVSGIAGTTTPILDVNGSSADIVIHHYTGGLQINNLTSNLDMTVDTAGGRLVIDASCNAATVVVRGDTKLVDNSSVGCTVVNETTQAIVWQHVIDGAFTAEEIQRLIASAVTAKLSGAATTTVVFRDLADTKDRVSMPVDASGNRVGPAVYDVSP